MAPQFAGAPRGRAAAPGRPVCRSAPRRARLGWPAAACRDPGAAAGDVGGAATGGGGAAAGAAHGTAAGARGGDAGLSGQRLAQVRGIAARSATGLAAELFSRQLRNRRQVGALTGLVSAPHRSGTIAWDQGVAPSGLPAVRRIAVEVAWAWLRYSADQCPHAVVSASLRRGWGGDAPHWNCGIGPAGHHRAVALCCSRRRAGGRRAESVAVDDGRAKRCPSIRSGSLAASLGFRKGAFNGFALRFTRIEDLVPGAAGTHRSSWRVASPSSETARGGNNEDVTSADLRLGRRSAPVTSVETSET